jgi:hypothetical protein
MKLEPMSNYSFRRKQKIIREPLYTLPEIADKLGMEFEVISGYMRGKRDEGKPKAAMVNCSSQIRMVHKLYKLSEFQLWIKELGETK